MVKPFRAGKTYRHETVQIVATRGCSRGEVGR